MESKGWTNVGRNVSLFLSDFFLPESDFALIYISRMIDRERFHPWIINGSRLNLIRKTLSRILIFLFLPFVSFRFEERDYRHEKDQRSNFDS